MQAQDETIPKAGPVGGTRVPTQPDERPSLLVRRLLIGFGCVMVALGVIGIFLPVVPTAPFVIVAAWAFSRSSRRFHDWLYRHPQLGPPLRAWHRHGVIPVRAKVLSVVGMWASLVLVLLFVAENWILPTVHAAIIISVTAFILSRPSRPPAS
jgi:uncharacterized protein